MMMSRRNAMLSSVKSISVGARQRWKMQDFLQKLQRLNPDFDQTGVRPMYWMSTGAIQTMGAPLHARIKFIYR